MGKSASILSLSVFLFIILGFSALAATIYTDKLDYSPFETVTITGEGFLPDAIVGITITDPLDYSTTYLTSSDSSGGFVYLYGPGLMVGTYYVLASDGTYTAETIFTDAAIWTTSNDCGSSSQNVNSYAIGDTVYINGDGFAAGTYDWDITGQPGGASCDPNIPVASGNFVIGSSGAFCFGSYTVQAGDCGKYSVNFGVKNDNYGVIGTVVCEPGATETRQCGDTDVGECSYGTETRTCDSSGQWSSWGSCIGAIFLSTEICDGKDNDCDGMTDEDLGTTPTTCGIGACASIGEISCVSGEWFDSCDPGNPLLEVCDDGVDNDCDGATNCDDRDCAEDEACEGGYCRDGTVNLGEECDDGNINNNDGCKNDCNLNVCGDGFLYSGVEYCETDGDCDDENPLTVDSCVSCNCLNSQTECRPGLTQDRQCGDTEVGECSFGTETRTCTANGFWGTWEGCNAVFSAYEVCNDAIDNDCDGLTDCDDGDCLEDFVCNGDPGEDEPKTVSVMGGGLFTLLMASAALLGIYGIKKYGNR